MNVLFSPLEELPYIKNNLKEKLDDRGCYPILQRKLHVDRLMPGENGVNSFPYLIGGSSERSC